MDHERPGAPTSGTEAPVRRQPGVSVVVCAFSDDRRARLVDAIASVRAQTRPAREIIVVIDHNPALLDWIGRHAEDVRVVANERPPGLSGARNTGVGLATGDIVAFLDDDAVAEPGWIDTLVATYEDPDVLGVGGHVAPDWETGEPAWLPAEFWWVVGCSYLGMPETRSAVRNLIGCNMSFRREVLTASGGFDEGLGRTSDRPLGCEETELCIRALQTMPRGRILYEPAARVSHHVPEVRARAGYFRRRCFAEGLSKARVSRAVGRGDGLSDERGHALRVLPRGVAREMRCAVATRRADPLRRTAAIVAGLAVTTAGYVVGSLTAAR